MRCLGPKSAARSGTTFSFLVPNSAPPTDHTGWRYGVGTCVIRGEKENARPPIPAPGATRLIYFVQYSDLQDRVNVAMKFGTSLSPLFLILFLKQVLAANKVVRLCTDRDACRGGFQTRPGATNADCEITRLSAKVWGAGCGKSFNHPAVNMNARRSTTPPVPASASLRLFSGRRLFHHSLHAESSHALR